jgi:predicted acyl esterase
VTPLATWPRYPLFETGVTNQWKTYNTWPPVEAADKNLYLLPGGKAKLSMHLKVLPLESFDEYVSQIRLTNRFRFTPDAKYGYGYETLIHGPGTSAF